MKSGSVHYITMLAWEFRGVFGLGNVYEMWVCVLLCHRSGVRISRMKCGSVSYLAMLAWEFRV